MSTLDRHREYECDCPYPGPCLMEDNMIVVELVPAFFAECIAECMTMHRICSKGDIDCFCDSPVGDEA